MVEPDLGTETLQQKVDVLVKKRQPTDVPDKPKKKTTIKKLAQNS